MVRLLLLSCVPVGWVSAAARFGAGIEQPRRHICGSPVGHLLPCPGHLGRRRGPARSRVSAGDAKGEGSGALGGRLDLALRTGGGRLAGGPVARGWIGMGTGVRAGAGARRRCTATAATEAGVNGAGGESEKLQKQQQQQQREGAKAREAESKEVVVVGAGWAGLGAAHALSRVAGVKVTLVDAAPQVGGLSGGFRTRQGRAVEGGIKGFWWQYGNIFKLMQDDLGMRLDDVLTDWTSSAFYSPKGLQVTAPVLHRLPRLPTPLGSFFYTSALFTSLPVVDRLTALPLIRALVEFDADTEAYAAYDTMTARELFAAAGVSQRLYDEFLTPMLLVTLFAPPEKLSAAAALGALYYYVLAHQADFDVRWCRGSIGERVFAPWCHKLTQQRGVTILPGRRVVDIRQGSEDDDDYGCSRGRVSEIVSESTDGSRTRQVHKADAVVMAVGVRAMQRMVGSIATLAEVDKFRDVCNMACVDVVAVRLWLDRRVPLPYASNVLAGFRPDVGGTFFDLTQLQDEYKDEAGSVIEVDLYHAGSMIALPDDMLINELLYRWLAVCQPDLRNARVVDHSVLRYPQAVTLFSPGSQASMPRTRTPLCNAFVAGDWVWQGHGAHGARGLSQEKAFVTGLRAANEALACLGFPDDSQYPIVEVEEDEAHVAAFRELARQGRAFGREAGLRWPWLRM